MELATIRAPPGTKQALAPLSPDHFPELKLWR